MRSFILACFVSLACATAHAAEGIPLNDLGPAPYRLGYIGGLYENGSNLIPADHLEAGMRLARLIEPLSPTGQPSSAGKIGFLMIGDGDTDRIVCSPFPDANAPCEPGSFTAMVRASSRVNPAVTVINTAFESFVKPDLTTTMDRIENSILPDAGITDQQVQVAWMQMSMDHPTVDLTCACSDTYNLKIYMANALRRIKHQYPNLRIAYLSGRPFAGYSADAWNKEPFAYDSSIMMRIMIFDQLDEARTGLIGNDGRVGQINYVKGEAPWIAWGPYMWANGTTPRSDGLTWQPEDYDGEFLSEVGAHKAATLLFDFLQTDPTARIWFSNQPPPTRDRSVRH